MAMKRARRGAVQGRGGRRRGSLRPGSVHNEMARHTQTDPTNHLTMKITLLLTLASESSPSLPLQPLTHAALLSATSAKPTPRAPPKAADECAKCTIKTPYPAVDSYLNGNCRWAAATNKADPTFLPTLATAQHPPLLWIGCADSRVPETVITKKRPGDIFVHVSWRGRVVWIPQSATVDCLGLISRTRLLDRYTRTRCARAHAHRSVTLPTSSIPKTTRPTQCSTTACCTSGSATS